MRRDRNFLLLITLVTLFLWHPLLSLVLQWEAYMYLIPGNVYENSLQNIWGYPTIFNLQGMILGAFMTRAFGTHMEFYFAFQIASILVTNFALFFLAKTLLKNSFTAFLATIIFASNFFALADIHRSNLYSGVFLERLPFNIPLMIGSFILLHTYMERNEIRALVFSLVAFIFAIFISRFSIYFAFPFFFYPFFMRFFSSRKLKEAWSALLITLLFVLTTVFFLQPQSDGLSPVPKIALFEFILTPHISRYPESIVRQFVSIFQFPTVIKALKSGYQPLAFDNPQEVSRLILPSLVAYFVGFVFVYTKKQYRALLCTIFFATISMLFLNTLIASRLDVFNSAGSSRYFYIPSIFLSIFWVIVLTTIFAKRYIITMFIVFVFFVINAFTFNYYFKRVFASSKKTETIVSFISRNINTFPQESLIVVGPSEDFGPYEAGFYTYHLGRERNIVFMTEHLGYSDWRSVASRSAHLLYLEFNMKCYCVKQSMIK